MNAAFIDLPLIHEPERHRFSLDVDGYQSFISYHIENGTYILDHTESDPALEGRGVASAMVEKLMNYFKENKMQMIARCPFIFSYLRRHPELQP